MNLGRLIVDIDGFDLSYEDVEILRHPYVGGIILFSRNYESPEQLVQLTQKIKSLRSPSLIIYVDQEGERVQRFKKDLSFLPSVDLLGKKFINEPNDALVLSQELGWLIGFELSCLGIDVNTMPVLDIDYSKSDIMKKRCFSSDPKIVSQLANAFLVGSTESGISNISKHYPGHGFAVKDSHIDLPEDNRTLKTILNNDLLPYKKIINYSVQGIMTSHVLYSKIDKYPPTLSKKWLNILKNDLRFNGLIYSDDLSMKALDIFGDIESNLLKSIEAGCDCLFICNDRNAVMSIIDNIKIEEKSVLSENIRILNNKNKFLFQELFKNKKRLLIKDRLEKINEKIK